MKIVKLLILALVLIVVNNLKAQVSSLQNREFVNLKEWKYLKGITNYASTENFDDTYWEKVTVPHTFSMDAIDGIGYYRGQAWYRNEVDIPKSMENKRIFIRFEGVGHEATVYLNDKKIGNHIGGYSAFCFEITEAVKFNQKNTIAVNVTNQPNFKRLPVNDALFNEYGGIYRSVQIFSTPQLAISPVYHASSGVFIEVKNVNQKVAKIEVRTHISNKVTQQKTKLKYTIKNNKNKEITSFTKSVDLLKINQMETELIEIENPIRWNARINPYLYQIDVELINGDEVDKVSQKFGIKTFEVDANKGFILNDEEYRLYGVSKHQEWQQYGPALTNLELKKDMELINEIGATSLRLAHYQHSDLTYELADEKGILVWAEIPFVHDYSGREGNNAKQQLTELILQNYNHPSIFVWGLWNEVRAWESPEEPCVVLTKELNSLAHNLDKTRLTTSASDRDILSNMGGITDLQAWNKYFGWYYGSYEDMGAWLDTSHKNHPEIKIGLSEYGVGGNIAQQDLTKKVEKPVGNYFPEREQTKYHEITWKILKERPYVWATFIWNMFDFSVADWNRGGVRALNHKGIVTFDRKTNKDAFYFYKANWSKEPVLYIVGRREINRPQLTSLKVYTNLKEVTLHVNGQKLATKKMVSDVQIIIFENVELVPGDNTIKVVSKDKNIKLEDEVVFKVQL